MEMEKHKLATSWTLEAHPAYKVYSNKDSYIILDEESDVVLGFTIDNTILDVTRSSWNVRYKVRIDTRTITITTNPEEDEEDEE